MRTSSLTNWVGGDWGGGEYKSFPETIHTLWGRYCEYIEKWQNMNILTIFLCNVMTDYVNMNY